jgi:hypothetical protein
MGVKRVGGKFPEDQLRNALGVNYEKYTAALAKAKSPVSDVSERVMDSLVESAAGKWTAKQRLSSIETSALGRRIDQLVNEAAFFRKEAARYKREAGKDASGKLSKLQSRSRVLERNVDALNSEYNAVNRLEAKQHRVVERALDKAYVRFNKLSSRVDKIKKILEKSTIRTLKTRQLIVERVEKLVAKINDSYATIQSLTKKTDEIAAAATNKRAALSERMKRLDAKREAVRKGLATIIQLNEKLNLSKELTGLRKAKLAEVERLTGVKTAFEAAEDKLMQDINGEFLLPTSFVDAVNETLDSGFDFTQQHHRFLRAWQDFQKVWKTPLTLPFAENHFRNAITNVGLTATRLGLRMLNPQIWRTTANVTGHLLFKMASSTFGRGKQVLPERARLALERVAARAEREWASIAVDVADGRKIKVSEIAHEVLGRGVNHGFVHAELGFTPFQMFDTGVHGTLTSPLKVVYETIKGSAKKGAALTEVAFDIPFRIALFTDEVIQGKSYAEAAETVREYLNDWSRLSKKEKTYMRSAIPFYSWMQFSLERAFKDMIAVPGRFLVPFKTAQAAQTVILGSNPPPDYQPEFLNEKLGIWLPPNEHGYYTKLIMGGLNQQEAYAQMHAMSDFAAIIARTGIGLVSQSAAAAAIPAPKSDEATLRVLAQMDFASKTALEALRGRQFFDNSPTGTDQRMLITERSRLESGRGLEDLDKGVIHGLKTTGPIGGLVQGVGGQWLKNWLEFTEEGEVSAYRRWVLGQTPVARFVSTYQQRVKHKKPGEVNYLAIAQEILAQDMYRYHPAEGRYYRDRARLRAVAALQRHAHMIEAGVYYWNADEGSVKDPVTMRALEKLEGEFKSAPVTIRRSR